MNAVGGLRLSARLAQAATRRHLRETRIFFPDNVLDSSDELSSMADPAQSNSGAMDPASLLAALDPIFVKHCGVGHCTSFYKVVQDGQELWRAEVRVPWPREMIVKVEAPSKTESLLEARARMCFALQELGIFDSEIIPEPPHEGAGEPCPSRASSSGVIPPPCSLGQAGTSASPALPAGRLPSTQAQETVRRSQRLKSWTEKKQLSRAKSVVHNIYAYVCKLKDDKSLMASYNSSVKQGKVCHWTSTVTVTWPCELAFEGNARNKAEAEALAAAALVQYLTDKGHVDKDLSPKTVSDQEMQRQKNQRIAPVSVALPKTFIPNMQEILAEFETTVANAPHLPDDEIEEEAAGSDVVPDNAGAKRTIYDIMTGWPLTVSSKSNSRIDRELMAKD
ncbi:uncharacterized protein LOC119431037 [Dermacentor silvarum]|uniref:uncharacterized protein LOC119431037 n=1 Tax=Dermacentor silvarum TaxID=543639 RepID=UPI002100EE4F|nr:uncharacterized protein LOC119431037 [Dermacentor silvarum]